MSNLHLVTGYAGEAHITPDDHGSLYAGIFGSGSYVLDRGNRLSASALTSNQIRVLDGDMIVQGRHVRLPANSHVDLTIENGAQGIFRNDLIVARYTKNNSTGVEECNLVVIKGTAAASDPQDPEHIVGDILGGGTNQHDFPLYRVALNGLAVSLEQLFDIVAFVTVGADGKIGGEFLPAMDYIPTNQKGATGGVASLDSSGKVPSSQLPSMNYIPTSQKGAASGVAPLDANKKVPTANLPTIPSLSSSVSSTSTTTAANSYAVKQAYDKANSAASVANSAAKETVLSVSVKDGTYSDLTIHARRIGNIVFVRGRVYATNGSGYVKLSGLPEILEGEYVCFPVTAGYSTEEQYAGNLHLDLATGYNKLELYCGAGTVYFEFFYIAAS